MFDIIVGKKSFPEGKVSAEALAASWLLESNGDKQGVVQVRSVDLG